MKREKKQINVHIFTRFKLRDDPIKIHAVWQMFTKSPVLRIAQFVDGFNVLKVRNRPRRWGIYNKAFSSVTIMFVPKNTECYRDVNLILCIKKEQTLLWIQRKVTELGDGHISMSEIRLRWCDLSGTTVLNRILSWPCNVHQKRRKKVSARWVPHRLTKDPEDRNRILCSKEGINQSVWSW